MAVAGTARLGVLGVGVVAVGALSLAVGACGTAQKSAGGASPTTVAATPADGTAPFVAPPRSAKPIFTGEAAKVEATLRASLAAYEQGDAQAAYVMQSTKRRMLPENSVNALQEFMDAYRVVLYRINTINVKGDRATLDYENAIVGRSLQSDVTTLLHQHDVWVKEDGEWRSDSGSVTTPGIPPDLATVDVAIRDGERIDIPAPLPTTDFAFRIENRGKEARGLFILGIPADLDVSSFFDRHAEQEESGFDDGILEMGATPDISGRATGTMVFSKQLPSGRYLLVARTADAGAMIPSEYADFVVP